MKVYFKDSELACPCCGIVNYTEDSFGKLNKSRGIADIPFIISSACRCPKHNLEVGGSETSSHIATIDIKSSAYDIKVTNGTNRYRVVFALLAAGFNRIGIAKSFIHADTDENKPEKVIWVY